MGDQAMTTCIEEQLCILRPAAKGKLQHWYDEGADVRALVASVWIGGQGLVAPTVHVNGLELIHYAWGYLEGIADCLDLTVGEMVEHYGLSFDAPQPAKRQRIRKVSR